MHSRPSQNNFFDFDVSERDKVDLDLGRVPTVY